MSESLPHHRGRPAPLHSSPEEFRHAGHALVDRIADFLAGLPDRPVTPGEEPAQVRAALDAAAGLPQQGAPMADLLEQASTLVSDHSLIPNHPRFMGYVIGSAAPIGMLADLLAASINPNAGAWILSPIATEIEQQSIRWMAELIGYTHDRQPNCGGILVSGGNMANMVGFFAARKAKTHWDLRAQGLAGSDQDLVLYASEETHTWVQKAADLSGLGTDAIRWIATDDRQCMQLDELRAAIARDRENGQRGFMVVATGGTVSTGAVDPLDEIADLCAAEDLWLHVDGAYGVPAACLPELADTFRGLDRADSIAMDPHKWLYAPLEAAVTIVRDPAHLSDAFSFKPPYYKLDHHGEDSGVNFYEYGPQNSRCFRALKVWLCLKQAGRDGYQQMIREDIALAAYLDQRCAGHAELEACATGLSITTFRYRPLNWKGDSEALNALNEELLARLQTGGRVFISNALIDGQYQLRACVTNFRTTEADMDALVDEVVKLGRELAE